MKNFQCVTALICCLFILLVSSVDARATNSKVSIETYLETQFACQKIIEDFNWSNRIWPSSNTKAKPPRSAVISDQDILDRVMNDVLLEAVMSGVFELELPASWVQGEMNRMAAHTQDAKLLLSLFEQLDNDPNKIADCIVRPYLIKKHLQEIFYWDEDIHHDTRQQVEYELSLLKTDQHAEVQAQISTVTYQRVDKQHSTLADGIEPLDQVELVEKQFNAIKNRVKEPQLLVHESAFVYEQVLSQSEDQITVKSWVWPKLTFADWWQQIAQSSQLPKIQTLSTDYLMPHVTGTSTLNKAAPVVADTWINRFIPEARFKHTAVWTGFEMIVWGGRTPSLVNTGGRYNPVLDHWITTTVVNAPVARREHTAIWTGNGMIVWGGVDSNSNYLSSGGRYNPLNDSWVATNPGNAPTARERHTAVWTGSEMLVWGGRDSSYLNSGGHYDPISNSWEATGLTNRPARRSSHTAVWTGEEMIVWGGSNDLDTFLDTGGNYDPVTKVWTSTSVGSAPVKRVNHTAVWTGNEMIVWGGLTDFGILNDGARYSPSSNSWLPTSGSNVPAARNFHTAIWSGTEMVVWGGSGNSGNLSSGSKYNPTANTWSSTSSSNSPQSRSNHTAIWTGNKMVVWGGYVSNNPVDTGGQYNPSNNTWQRTSEIDVPTGRILHQMVWTGNEMVVWGGFNSGFVGLNTGSQYNPVTDFWLKMNDASAPSARLGHTMIWTGSEVIVWGGGSSVLNTTLTNTGAKYSPMTDSWLPTGITSAPSSRQLHSAVWTGDEMIVWAGFSGGSVVNTGGRYNPQTDSWLSTSTVNAPSSRLNSSAVWSGDEMIVWGGSANNTAIGSGGMYNPVSNSWQAISSSNQPVSRQNNTAVWTGSEMIIWGGSGSSGYLNSGGRFNPVTNNWSTISSTGAPAARNGHSAVWTGEEMIIWGGSDGSLFNSGGVYRMNNSWSPTSQINTPTAVSGHKAVWTGSRMLVFGGSENNNFPNSLGIYFPFGSYLVSGTVSGLQGDQVSIQNNSSDDIIVTADGGFSFQQAIFDGDDYAVSVVSQPSAPNQVCTVQNGTGTIAGAHVTDVVINCVTNQYTVGGNVSGLAAGNSITLTNNGFDSIIVSNNGAFSFAAIDDYSTYDVGISLLPSSPNQSCQISNGAGAIAGAAVSDVEITCQIIQYTVGGAVSGLAPGNQLSLANNGAESQLIAANTTFNFSLQDDSSAYAVTVVLQPQDPSQTCQVTGGGVAGDGSGVLNGQHVTDILVNCVTNQFTVGGTVSGLAAGNSVTLENNAGDPQVVSGNGSFSFAAMDDLSSYSVSVIDQPTTPNQTCSVSNGVGSIAGSNITAVLVNCVTNQYTVGGTVSGLAAGNSVTLLNNGGNSQVVSNNSSFSFPATDDLSPYAVIVSNQPTSPNQICNVTNGSGAISGANVSNVLVHCVTDQFTLSGELNGLAAGNSLLIRNQGVENLTLSTNGNFSLPTAVNDGSGYNIQIVTQPTSPDQTCTVSNGSGVVSSANVNNISIACVTQPTVINDVYSTNEDSLLNANDAVGSVTSDSNDNGVLANDTDPDADVLEVLSPGTYTADGIGGLITIASDGTFVYTPPVDAFGQASLDFWVTDGLYALSSTLIIDVVSSNDAPEFSISGDVAVNLFDPNNNPLQVIEFASDIVLGPNNESTQQVLQFNTFIQSDSNSVIDQITVSHSGLLNIEFTGNYGVALIEVSLQDNGGVENGGEDTSDSLSFVVAHTDIIHANGFESNESLKLNLFLNNEHDNVSTKQQFPIYDEESESVLFYGFMFELNTDKSNSQIYQALSLWKKEVLYYLGLSIN